MPVQVSNVAGHPSPSMGSITSGLGFKFCEEQILGQGSSFDDSFLEKLEPANGSNAKFCKSIEEKGNQCIGERLCEFLIEPELNISGGDIDLMDISLVADMLGEEEENGIVGAKLNDSFDELRKKAVSDICESFRQASCPLSLAQRIERDIHSFAKRQGNLNLDSYRRTLSNVLDIISIDVIQYHLLNCENGLAMLAELVNSSKSME